MTHLSCPSCEKERAEMNRIMKMKEKIIGTKGLVLESQSCLYSPSHWHMMGQGRKVWKGQESREILVLPYCSLDTF